MATPSRFELPISSLTGRRVRPLHHGAGFSEVDAGFVGRTAASSGLIISKWVVEGWVVWKPGERIGLCLLYCGYRCDVQLNESRCQRHCNQQIAPQSAAKRLSIVLSVSMTR